MNCKLKRDDEFFDVIECVDGSNSERGSKKDSKRERQRERGEDRDGKRSIEVK